MAKRKDIDVINMLSPAAPTVTAVQAQPSEELNKAYEVHYSIVAGANLFQQGLYQMGIGFKTMRDEKLYKVMGYATFADYCEQETGIKYRQVHNYISIVEKLPSDYVQLNAHSGTKLSLLTTLDDEIRGEIVESVDLESVTVSELKETIKSLKDSKEQTEKELSKFKEHGIKDSEEYKELENANKGLEMLKKNHEEKISELKESLANAEKAIDESKGNIEELNNEISELNAKLASVDITDTEEYKTLSAQLEEKQSSYDSAVSEIESLKKEIADLESRPVEVAVEKDDTEIEKLKQRLKEANKTIKELNTAKKEQPSAYIFHATDEQIKRIKEILSSEQELSAIIANAKKIDS